MGSLLLVQSVSRMLLIAMRICILLQIFPSKRQMIDLITEKEWLKHSYLKTKRTLANGSRSSKKWLSNVKNGAKRGIFGLSPSIKSTEYYLVVSSSNRGQHQI